MDQPNNPMADRSNEPARTRTGKIVGQAERLLGKVSEEAPSQLAPCLRAEPP